MNITKKLLADCIEVWRPVKDYEGLYEVSSKGQVRSLKRSGTVGKILKQDKVKYGYYRIELSKFNIHKHKSVHRLVAEAFIVNSKNKPFVNHIDNNPSNNYVNNLEWCTQSENLLHAKKQGRLASKKGELNHFAKLRYIDIPLIKRLFNLGKTHQEIALIYNVHRMTISRIVRDKIWQ